MQENPSPLENFDGTARLFPLPNLVLFPNVVQGLHVFEPRYRQMTADALAGDRLIAVVLLQPGWEQEYHGRPAICPVGCLGLVVEDERLEDGRFNIQLRGLARARIIEEFNTGKSYRSARVELLPDMEELPNPNLKRNLLEVSLPWCPGDEPAASAFRKFLQSGIPLGVMCDVLGYALPIIIEVKQELLENSDVKVRARRLIQYLQENKPPHQSNSSPADSKFPPDFSTN